MTDSKRLQERRLVAARLFETRADDRRSLEQFRMTPVATFGFAGGRMFVLTNDTLADSCPGVYAFVAAHRVIRVGSASGGVPRRLRQYPGDINKAADGLKSPAPLWEALLWQHVLETFGGDQPEIWARASLPLSSTIGVIPPRMACKAEEFLVAGAFAAPGLGQPLLNRSKRIT